MSQEATRLMRGLYCVLSSVRLRTATEAALQQDVERILIEEAIDYDREADLGECGRIEFLTSQGIGIECKTDGGPSAVLEQLLRYADSDKIKGLILVTRKHTHRMVPGELRGKPAMVVWTGRNL